MIRLTRRFIGIIMLVLSIILFFVLYQSTLNYNAMAAILHKDCPLPSNICPFQTGIPREVFIGGTLNLIFTILALYLIFTQEKVVEKKAIPKDLLADEKQIYNLLVSSGGVIFQSELIEKTNLNKVKITRILDKLEGKGFIERRRRGMSNVVILK